MEKTQTMCSLSHACAWDQSVTVWPDLSAAAYEGSMSSAALSSTACLERRRCSWMTRSHLSMHLQHVHGQHQLPPARLRSRLLSMESCSHTHTGQPTPEPKMLNLPFNKFVLREKYLSYPGTGIVFCPLSLMSSTTRVFAPFFT